VLNSILAPCSEMLRTTQSMVRAIVADLGDPAIDNLVARALASIQHRIHSPKRRGPYAALPHAKGRTGKKRR